VAKYSGPDLKCNKIKLLIRESLPQLKINCALLIPKNVSKSKVWICLVFNLVRKHFASFLAWDRICLGCLSGRQVVFWGIGECRERQLKCRHIRMNREKREREKMKDII